MEFGEQSFDKGPTFWGLVGLLCMLGLATAGFYWPVSWIVRGEEPGLIALSCAGFVVGLALLYPIWLSCFNLKVELSNPPREARCWRRNIFTGRTNCRCYPIREDAKVILKPRGGGGRDRSAYYWPIKLTALPSYYDFWELAGCKTQDDANSVSATVASYLGLRLFSGKIEVPLESLRFRPWTGPKPEHPGHHEHRRRRKR